MEIQLSQPYEDLTFMTPLSEGRANTLVNFLAASSPSRVVDIGCGWAELLLRVVACTPSCMATGVDVNEVSIAHGRQLAQQRGLTERVNLLCADGRDHMTLDHDAVICIGASQVWGRPVEDNQPLDYTAALTAIREILPRAGRLIYGEVIWSRPPTPQALNQLSGRADELVTTADLADLAVAAGFAPVSIHEASLGEWDAFESGYNARYASWLASHEYDHPDAVEVRERASRQRDKYLRGYRDVMGMAYLQLVAV